MSPESTTRILALPSLRKQAEEDAREYHAAYLANPVIRACTWEEFSEDQRQDRVSAQAALLTDLTRWQSQAWALRRIAELLGWNVGCEVQTFYLDMVGYWVIDLGHEPVAFVAQPANIPGTRVEVVPGLLIDAGMSPEEIRVLAEQPPTDPARRARVLAAILLHLEPR